MSHSLKVGIVGATGAVGQELIRLLQERSFPYSELRLLASARSAGKIISRGEESWKVEEATPEAFRGLDVAIFSASGGISLELAPEAVKRGCTVIDNSSAFRMHEDVPLVIPEINPEAIEEHRGIIANPNCSTAIALMGLYPLHRAFGLKRFFASTYQAVSGTGNEAIHELDEQVRAYAKGESSDPAVYPYPIAFNLLPHIDSFTPGGYTKEEVKMLNESRKILGLASLRASVTCVRVPVFRSHAIAVSAEFDRPVDLAVARQAINDFPGIETVDEPEKLRYPMPLDFAEKVECGIGRLRIDSAFDNGISCWIVGDQLWKGAALNAVQIAEHLYQAHPAQE